MRFHARFFLGDGRHAIGEPLDGAELEQIAWYPADNGGIGPLSGVTRFMIEHAVAVWRGAANTAPLYHYVGGVARVTIRAGC
jgi:hypothetical protein